MSSFPEKHVETPHETLETLPPIGYERVIKYIDTELNRIKPFYNELLQARHDLYDMSSSALDSSKPIKEQLYDEHSYNTYWTKPDLRLRPGGAEFHNESESLDDAVDDSEEHRNQKHLYRQSIMEVARAIGGYLYPDKPGKSPHELERYLGIRESTLSPENPVHATELVIPAAAGITNHKRILGAVRDIKSGALDTKKIIITTGERRVSESEKNRIEAKGYRSGESEFESVLYAFEDITGIALSDLPTHTRPATYGISTPDMHYKQTTTTIGGKQVEVIILEASYGRENRHEVTGQPIGRAGTDETFYAALSFMDKGAGLTVIESHDIWIPYQEVIGHHVFGLYANRDVLGIGPFNDGRVVVNGDGELDITSAQAVVDEIGKKHDDLVKLRLQAENAHSPELALLGRLIRPIPDMHQAYERKQNYRKHPIHQTPETESEPLVPVADYGIAGQSYYSRPNATLSEAIPGVPREIYLRQSIAKTLQTLNAKLEHPIVTAFFGGEVELYIEEGIRDRTVQQLVREEAFPTLLRRNHPTMSPEEIKKKTNDLFALPSKDGESPSPHETGAAFDIILRYKQPSEKGFVPDCNVDLGHADGQTGDSITPDYFEHSRANNADDARRRNFRRAFYNIMTGAAFTMTTGFVVNPTEFWHWSRHDQLAAKVAGQPAALYGAARNI